MQSRKHLVLSSALAVVSAAVSMAWASTSPDLPAVRTLGTKTAMLLRNHGLVVLGRTVSEAYVLAVTLIKACRIQIAAQSGNAALHRPRDEVIAPAAGDGGAVEGRAEWPALPRKLDRLSPLVQSARRRHADVQRPDA